MPRARPATSSVSQVLVTLHRTEPPVWRRLLVPNDMRLGTLHRVLQCVFEWENYHLHQFIVGDTIVYEYDFGDSWWHGLLLEAILPADEDRTYPLCVAGARARPPEDVGGSGGTKSFWKRLTTLSMRSTRRCSPG